MLVGGAKVPSRRSCGPRELPLLLCFHFRAPILTTLLDQGRRFAHRLEILNRTRFEYASPCHEYFARRVVLLAEATHQFGAQLPVFVPVPGVQSQYRQGMPVDWLFRVDLDGLREVTDRLCV